MTEISFTTANTVDHNVTRMTDADILDLLRRRVHLLDGKAAQHDALCWTEERQIGTSGGVDIET